MKIGIIGSGGREHSLCFKILQSKIVEKVFCIPGNAGTSKIAENLNLNILDFGLIHEQVLKNKIDLLIVGPEVPLVEGIVDYFEKKKVKIFGPSKKASKLEGSKIFMKNFCEKFNIPTAKFAEIKNLKQANKFIDEVKLPIVVKSDGLASGKGVTICYTREEALHDIKNIFNGKFQSSTKVILEEFLTGEEASYFVITDGKNFKPIGTAQDHKRIGEGDTGPNTGGMGAYSPSLLINKRIENKVISNIIIPTLDGMKSMGFEYKGILYAGLMIENDEPKLIEYNIRFGDPECQVIMMRLKNDLLDLILSVINNNINQKKILWDKKPCITIVASNKGYPENYNKNTEIKNIDEISEDEDVRLFHAGTEKNQSKKIIATGGRVLNSTVKAKSLKIARSKSLKLLDKINWVNKYYRRDIGYKVIK